MKHYMDIENLREFDIDLGNGMVRPNNCGAFEPGDYITITEKIDGSNFSVRKNPETKKLDCFSRKQELSFNNTLNGAWNFVQTLDPADFPEQVVVFGEWTGARNKIVYNEDARGKWYVFDIYNELNQKYMPYEAIKHWTFENGYDSANLLYQGEFISWDHCRSFLNIPSYGNVQEGCFNSQAPILMSDGSQKLIKDIKPGDVVKSYNIETKTIEDKKVINVFFNGRKQLDNWKQISVFSRGVSGSRLINGSFRATKNHKFFDGNGYTEIQYLDYVYHYGLIFDDYRKQAFLGMMCSDGNLSKGRFSYTQRSDRMLDYETLFEDFLCKKRQIHISGKGSEIKTISFIKQLTEPLYDEYAINDNTLDYIKCFKELNEIGWAYFFMGDGSYDPKRGLGLSLSSYSDDEVREICDAFSQVFNIEYYLYRDNRVSNGSGLEIRSNANDSKEFIRRVSPHILPSFRYKIIEASNNTMYIPNVEYGIVKRKLHTNRKVSELKTLTGHNTIGAWDIEVEDNHNYFVGGCLVHNCVVKNQTKLGDKSVKLPVYLKIVNEAFQESMKTKEINVEAEAAKTVAQEFAKQIVTRNRVEKMLLKLRDEQILGDIVTPEDMRTVAKNLPNRVYEDCVKEEPEIVQAMGQYAGKAISSKTMQLAREILL